jgi:YHS domain-containing protein
MLLTTAILALGAAMFTGCKEKAPDASAQLCPVSGEKLGSMGDPYVFEYEGKQIKLCCDGCKEDFLKEPAKYLAETEK